MFTAKEAILHRMAIGHQPGADGYVPTRRFLMPECLAPAGTTFITSVRDTLTFMQTHLPAVAAGPRLLSSESVDRMAAHHIDFPVPELGSVGLSWLRKQHGPRVVLTHGGGSFGRRRHGRRPSRHGCGVHRVRERRRRVDAVPRDLAEAILQKRFGRRRRTRPTCPVPAPEPEPLSRGLPQLGRRDPGHRRRRCSVLPAEVHRADLRAGLAHARSAPAAADRRPGRLGLRRPPRPAAVRLRHRRRRRGSPAVPVRDGPARPPRPATTDTNEALEDS